MKNKSIIIGAILFFLLLNTSLLWEKLPGFWDMGITAVLIIAFLSLMVVLLVQIVLIIIGRFKNKEKNISTAVLASVLLLSILFPYGIVDSAIFEEPNLIYAQYEGVANCTETLKIKQSGRFKHSSICFGVDEYEGAYKIIGDTIKLQYESKAPLQSKLAYGIIKLDSIVSENDIGTIMYYRDLRDEKPIPLTIAQYDL
jgi:hypothetical protein